MATNNLGPFAKSLLPQSQDDPFSGKTDAELQAERDRRARIAKSVPMPPLLATPELTALRQLCVDDLAQTTLPQ